MNDKSSTTTKRKVVSTVSGLTPDDCYHIQALFRTREKIDLPVREIARRMNINSSSLNNVLNSKRSFPTVPSIENLLEVFEYEKPGCKLYYQLQLFGFAPEDAEAIAFKNPHKSSPKSDEDIQAMSAHQQKSQFAQFVGDCIIQKQIDFFDLVTTECDSETITSLFLACLTKLEQEDIPLMSLSEN